MLLVNHKKLGVWLYPGGHVEDDETPDGAVVREVKEETGLDVEIIGDIDNSLEDKDMDVSVLKKPYQILCEFIKGGESHYHIDLVYFCSIIGSEELTSNDKESHDIRFFSYNELDGIALFPSFRKLLEKVFKEHK